MAEKRVGTDVVFVVALMSLLVALGLLLADTTVTLVLLPVVYALAIYAMARLPLRVSMMALMFLALTVQDASDRSAAVDFEPPLYNLGVMLFTHLNAADRTVGATWASFSGMDLGLVALIVIAAYRRATNSNIDRAGGIPTPAPLIRLAFLSLAGTAWVWLFGMLRGGDFRMSLWQLNRVMYVPIVFLLFQAGLRGPKDLAALWKVVIVAAVYKAFLALYVVRFVSVPLDPLTGSTVPAWATSHQDSILFATAFVAVLAMIVERAYRRKTLKWYLLLLAVIGVGTWANNRRTAWVQIAAVFITVYFLTDPNNPVKRKIRRGLYTAVPFLALYFFVGWDSTSRIFKPARIMRSIVDAQSDSSSLWRELENFNLIQTIRHNPIFGTGYGHGYEEVITLPFVDYDLELYAPHNSLLGIWAYAGLVGYTTLTLLWAVGVYFAVRAYQSAKEPVQRAAALVCFGTILIYMVQCWGDLGIGAWIGIFTVSAAIAVAGKLAVGAREWETKKAKRRPPMNVAEPGIG